MMLKPGKILLLCEDRGICAGIKDKILKLGDYDITVESGLPAAIESFSRQSFDLVIIKPPLAKFSAAFSVTEIKNADLDAVIIILLDSRDEDEINGLIEVGGYDFLISPVNTDKLKFAIDKGIKLRVLLATNREVSVRLKQNNQALEKQNMLLVKRIEDATTNLSRLYEDLRSTYLRTIRVLAQAIDARDHYTHSHSENVARYAVEIANFMKLPPKDIEVMRQACELHDLGKIGIGDNVLLKGSGLTEQEWEEVRKHPVIGAQILEPLTFLNGVVDLVRQHHEHYDGSGYPDGRKGNDILLGARIIHIADAYEAMRSARSYRKKPFFKEEAILEIKRNSGTQFDPKLVVVFLKVVNDF
jgi:putative nucleotidyltransferase with HDIG domain